MELKNDEIKGIIIELITVVSFIALTFSATVIIMR